MHHQWGNLCFLRFNTIISSHWVPTAIYFLMLFVLSLKKKKILPKYHNDAVYSASDPNQENLMVLPDGAWGSPGRCCSHWSGDWVRRCAGDEEGRPPVSSQLPELRNLNLFNKPLQIFTLKIEAFLISAFNPFNNKINASSSSRITWNWLRVM